MFSPIEPIVYNRMTHYPLYHRYDSGGSDKGEHDVILHVHFCTTLSLIQIPVYSQNDRITKSGLIQNLNCHLKIYGLYFILNTLEEGEENVSVPRQ